MELAAPAKELLPVIVNEGVLEREASKSPCVVPLVVTSTKPDFYKQWPLLPAFEKAGLPCAVMNTGQHFDPLLGHGLDEFGIRERIAIDLQIRGNLSEKTSEVVAKLAMVGNYLRGKFSGKKFLPIVHGDTHAAGIVPLGWMFATNGKSAQNEAGLRAWQPSFRNRRDARRFLADQRDARKWAVNRTEPFPEQYDTFIGGAACHYHFAPVELNKDSLMREGYPEKNIAVVGNSVVEAMRDVSRRKRSGSVFDEHPALEKGEWIRVDIHRRENLLPGRFAAILSGMRRLVGAGKKVVFIEMTANKFAIDSLGLAGEIAKLKGETGFLYTGLWKEYGSVVEFLRSAHCEAELTDSGSMQEELNELQGPACLTCRFSTDRPESVFEGRNNLVIPPISGEYVEKAVHAALCGSLLARKGKRLYGNAPSRKIAAFLRKRLEEDTFEWAHERAGVAYPAGDDGTRFL